MAAQENLKPLKTLVFSMGILLIAGTVLLFGLVLKKMSRTPVTPALASCPGGHIDLKGHGAIVDTTISGNVMRVSFEKQPGNSETVMIDICSGKILGTLTLDTDAPIDQQ